ncbi:unnamed protein product [Brachionus calyciflorus]|uniref:RING-type domain-containing protein n=1 Tax=Brachionus calyciflorus TaxID=104777 RepID=A0A814Q8U0_9BILA|nr:unnamed protein product [Brachionus calyciflorus]
MIFLGEILKEEKTIGDYIIEPNDMIIVESTFQDDLEKFKSLPRAFLCKKKVHSPVVQVGRAESGYMSFPNVSGFGFSNILEQDWRMVKAGLCLEGKCENSKCYSFNKMIIMNMGVPYIHHVGMDFNKKETKCPQCKSYVNTLRPGWRFSGILAGKDGPERILSDWKIVGDEYYEFSENSKVNWYSLAIETKLLDDHIIVDQLTKDICSICRDDFHDVVKKLKCNHILHFNCFEQLIKTVINPICPLCRAIID